MKRTNRPMVFKHQIRVKISDDEMDRLTRTMTGNTTVSQAIRSMINNLPMRSRGEEQSETENIRS